MEKAVLSIAILAVIFTGVAFWSITNATFFECSQDGLLEYRGQERHIVSAYAACIHRLPGE